MSSHEQASVVADPNALERINLAFRNSRLGQMVTGSMVALGLVGGIESAMAEASTVPDGSQQTSVPGLTRPRIIEKPTMYDAGIRLFTGFPTEQHVKGKFGLPPMPPGYTRAMTDQLQMQNPHDLNHRINLTTRTVGYTSNQAGSSVFFWAPTHPLPAWPFNQCVGKHGDWLKVWDVLTLTVRDEQSRQVAGKEEFTIPAEVIGNCAAARKSAAAAKKLPRS